MEQELRINGSRWADEVATIYGDEEKITVLCGFPPCPICFEVLSLRAMPDAGETHWHCKHCGTQWEITDLIKAINMEVA